MLRSNKNVTQLTFSIALLVQGIRHELSSLPHRLKLEQQAPFLIEGYTWLPVREVCDGNAHVR